MSSRIYSNTIFHPFLMTEISIMNTVLLQHVSVEQQKTAVEEAAESVPASAAPAFQAAAQVMI